jgi:hypothetical protein
VRSAAIVNGRWQEPSRQSGLTGESLLAIIKTSHAQGERQMEISDLCRQALIVCALVTALAGCNTGGSQVAPVGPMQQNGVASLALGANRVEPDRIIYTPSNVQIDNSSYNLDLNNDGTTDFTIAESNSQNEGCDRHTNYWGSLSVANSQSGGGVIGFTQLDGTYAEALKSGSLIGQGEAFSSGSVPMEYVAVLWLGYYHQCSGGRLHRGHWSNKTAYLGLAFPIRGKTHYGWAQLTVTCFNGNPCSWLTATLTGYAYQTRAGKSIKAGQM